MATNSRTYGIKSTGANYFIVVKENGKWAYVRGKDKIVREFLGRRDKRVLEVEKVIWKHKMLPSGYWPADKQMYESAKPPPKPKSKPISKKRHMEVEEPGQNQQKDIPAGVKTPEPIVPPTLDVEITDNVTPMETSDCENNDGGETVPPTNDDNGPSVERLPVNIVYLETTDEVPNDGEISLSSNDENISQRGSLSSSDEDPLVWMADPYCPWAANRQEEEKYYKMISEHIENYNDSDAFQSLVINDRTPPQVFINGKKTKCIIDQITNEKCRWEHNGKADTETLHTHLLRNHKKETWVKIFHNEALIKLRRQPPKSSSVRPCCVCGLLVTYTPKDPCIKQWSTI